MSYVSILVILEIQSDLKNEQNRIRENTMFQSLLSWKYNQILSPFIDDDDDRAFQSLLSWKYNQIQTIDQTNELKKERFNPCYLGNTIRSLRQVRRSMQKSCFNPCYLGNTIRSNARCCVRVVAIGVSILVILEIQSDHHHPYLRQSSRL